MSRNTRVVVALLAFIALAIIAVNIFPHSKKTTSNTPTGKNPTTQTVNLVPYKDDPCGIELNYPDNLNILEGPTGSVIFTGKTNANNVIIVTCQQNIPRPAISVDKIEALQSGSVSASLYHDSSAKDGTPIDKLIFTNPDNKLDIFISGYGSEFQQIIGNIKLSQ